MRTQIESTGSSVSLFRSIRFKWNGNNEKAMNEYCSIGEAGAGATEYTTTRFGQLLFGFSSDFSHLSK